MTLAASGQMSIGTNPGGADVTRQIQSEMSVTIGTQCGMNDANMRSLSGTSAGAQVSFSTFYGKSSVTVSASPLLVSYVGINGTLKTTATTTATGSPSAGTYAWAYLSGDAGATITSPSTGATAFRRTVASGGSYSTIFRCTYTKSGHSATVDVTATWDATN